LPVIPELGRLRQEDLKFEISLSYISRHYFKNQRLRYSSLVEHLPTMHKALGLSSSTEKRKGKKKTY
jgi:hypothetical protein